MTGWRLGWITGPKVVMDGVKKINVSAATHVATFMMPAATVALSLEEETAAMAASFKERCELIHGLLSELPGRGLFQNRKERFYAFCDITGTGMTDIEFAERALSEAKVQLIPGYLA